MGYQKIRDVCPQSSIDRDRYKWANTLSFCLYQFFDGLNDTHNLLEIIKDFIRLLVSKGYTLESVLSEVASNPHLFLKARFLISLLSRQDIQEIFEFLNSSHFKFDVALLGKLERIYFNQKSFDTYACRRDYLLSFISEHKKQNKNKILAKRINWKSYRAIKKLLEDIKRFILL